MSHSTTFRRAALIALAVIALVASLLAGYLAFYRSPLPGGLPSLPAPAKEPEITLTRAEAAALEAKLTGLALQVMAGGCEIEKITKDGEDFLVYFKTKDTTLSLRVQARALEQKSGK